MQQKYKVNTLMKYNYTVNTLIPLFYLQLLQRQRRRKKQQQLHGLTR